VRIGLLIVAIICLQLSSTQALLASNSYTSYASDEEIPSQIQIIRSIDISGLKKTRPRTVLRELPFSTGDIWQDGYKATGERRLRNTGLFAEAVITPPDRGGMVHIRVRDRWSLFLLPEASRSDAGKTSAGITLTEHNLWGLNHNLRLATREETGKNFTGVKGTSFNGSYVWRRINDGPLSLSVSGNTGRQIFDQFLNGQLSSQYREKNISWGTELSMAHGPVPGEGLGSLVGFSSSLSSFTLISGLPSATVVPRHRNAIQAGVTYQLIDNNITWLTGTSFGYRWDIAHRALGSNINVYRQTSSLSSHIPISDGDSTFDFRISGGGATGSVAEDGLFDIGSSRGLRGYLPGELQGTYYVYSNLEGRMPINKGSNFQLVGFTDVGQIWNLGQKTLGKNLIVGVGGGARWTLRWLVNGTFRSDISYGLATSHWRFYFGTGQDF